MKRSRWIEQMGRLMIGSRLHMSDMDSCEKRELTDVDDCHYCYMSVQLIVD
jgi:hypothetical protein